MPAKLIRLILLFVTALIVLWAFYDFGRRGYDQFRQRREKPVELTVLHWGNPDEDQIVEDLVRTFEKEHPAVRVTRINAGGDFRNKIMTMTAAGEPPDVFYVPPDQLAQYVKVKLIQPLDTYFATAPPEWRNNFFPLMLDAFRYDATAGTLGGNAPLYALPKDFTTAGFYINIDLFEQAGIDWKSIRANGWTWDEFEAAARKITALNDDPAFAGRQIYGTIFQIWPDSFRNILWTFGADYFATDEQGRPDFRNIALQTPGARDAISLVYRMRVLEHTAFNSSGIAKDGGQEFVNGNIGSIGPIGHWVIPTYKSIDKFRWDYVPVPKGTQQASQIYYNGWGMAAKTKAPDEAFELIRFLCGESGQFQMAEKGLAIPSLKSVAESETFKHPPGIPEHNSQLFLDAVEYARLGALPEQTEWSRIAERYLNRCIQEGTSTPTQVDDELEAAWHHELDAPLRAGEWRPFPWTPVIAMTLAVFATLVALIWWRSRREQLGPLDRATERTGYAFIAPWLIGFLVLTLGPMIVSLLLSFAQWSGLVPMAEAQYVGLTNFKQLFTYDEEFKKSLSVTAYYVLLGVPLTQIAALLVALLMNHNLRGITLFRTLFFVPSVISGVAMAMLWLQMFNNDYGLINKTLRPILGNPGAALTVVGVFIGAGITLLLLADARRRLLSAGQRAVLTFIGGFSVALLAVGIIVLVRGVEGVRPPNWFGTDVTDPDNPVNDADRWAIPGFVLMGLWGVGGGMIIYLAGLKGISASLYEAAVIDGAGPVRKFWNITLPMLSPLVFYNFVMGIIGSFQIFTQAYTMTGAGPDNATLFYVLNLYRQAFEFHSMGYASAMAWVLFVIVLILTLIVFRGSRDLVYYEGLKT